MTVTHTNYGTMLHNLEIGYNMIEDLEEQLSESQHERQDYDHLELQAELSDWKRSTEELEKAIAAFDESMNLNRGVYCELCNAEFKGVYA